MVDLDFNYKKKTVYLIEQNAMNSSYSILSITITGPSDVQVSVTMTMRMNDREGKPNEP